MGRLKAVGSSLTRLRPTLGSLAPVERSVDADRQLFAPWRRWYATARWKALRVRIFVRDLFTCQWPGCGFIGSGPAELIADHRKPHRGDEALFWDEGNIQTLCKPCHDRHKQRAERADQRV